MPSPAQMEMPSSFNMGSGVNSTCTIEVDSPVKKRRPAGGGVKVMQVQAEREFRARN